MFNVSDGTWSPDIRVGQNVITAVSKDPVQEIGNSHHGGIVVCGPDGVIVMHTWSSLESEGLGGTAHVHWTSLGFDVVRASPHTFSVIGT
jgi:hypothetical protein